MPESYYTAELAVVNGEETPSLFKWDSMDAARKRMHTQLSYYINFEGCSKIAVAILTDSMQMCRSEEWVAPQPTEE